MKEPECSCFQLSNERGGTYGVDMSDAVASETANVFGQLMASVGICKAAQEYTLMSTVCVLVHWVAAQHGGGSEETENVEAARILGDIGARLRNHEMQMTARVEAERRGGRH